MKEEIFESVLNEILEDQKQCTLVIKDLYAAVAVLTEKVAGFDQRLNEQVVAPPADTLAVQKVIDEGLARIEQRFLDSVEKNKQILTATFEKTNAIVEAQPKAIVRQFRFFHIPEHDPEGNFRYFVNRILLWLFGLSIVAALFLLGSHSMGWRY
jgi:hypothetical protein